MGGECARGQARLRRVRGGRRRGPTGNRAVSAFDNLRIGPKLLLACLLRLALVGAVGVAAAARLSDHAREADRMASDCTSASARLATSGTDAAQSRAAVLELRTRLDRYLLGGSGATRRALLGAEAQLRRDAVPLLCRVGARQTEAPGRSSRVGRRDRAIRSRVAHGSANASQRLRCKLNCAISRSVGRADPPAYRARGMARAIARAVAGWVDRGVALAPAPRVATVAIGNRSMKLGDKR